MLVDKYNIEEETINIYYEIEKPIWTLDNILLNINDNRINLEVIFKGYYLLDLELSKEYTITINKECIIGNKIQKYITWNMLLIKNNIINKKNYLLFSGFVNI